ncbi:hypothetical protein ABZ847_22445 [Streptomyces bauhiniae]
MQRTVMTSEGPATVPSPGHEWTVLFFITEPGIGERVPELGGCTTGLCSARDAAARFARAGVVLDRAGAVRSLVHPVHDPGRHAELVLAELDRLASAT